MYAVEDDMTPREVVIYRWHQELGESHSALYSKVISEVPRMLDLNNIGTKYRVIDLLALKTIALHGKK